MDPDQPGQPPRQSDPDPYCSLKAFATFLALESVSYGFLRHCVDWEANLDPYWCLSKDAPQLFIALVLNVTSVASADVGPNCLSCNAVAIPEQCRHVVRCKGDQQCYTQRILHDNKGVFYKLGCMPDQVCEFYNTHAHDAEVGKRAGTNFLQCSQCCREHFCNSNMCKFTNFTDDFFNCMECDSMADPANECHTIKTCPLGQQCYVKLAETRPGNRVFIYEMGCRTLDECNNEKQTFSHDGCIRCKNSSYANMHLCDDYLKTGILG